MNPARQLPPPPPGFATRFVAEGWKGVERLYGASTPVLLRWIEMTGGEELYQQRRARKGNAVPAVIASRKMR